MKNFTLVLLLSILIIGCGKSKEAVYDKCLTQANQTFEKNELGSKFQFMDGCMAERSYKRVDSYDCVGNYLSSVCFEKK
jgi:hypothetical protein